MKTPAPRDDANGSPERFAALKIALAYAAFGGLWIILSGYLLHRVLHEPHTAFGWEVAKGGLFVLVTAVLLWLTLVKYLRRVNRATLLVRESEQRYHSLFENMLDALAYCRVIYDGDQPRDYVYLEVNSAFEKLTGLKDVTGKRVSEVVPGVLETDPGLLETYGRVALTGVPERFETYRAALNIWFNVSVYSPSKGHFVAVFEVITERKRAEAALKEREEQLRLFVDHSPAAVAMFDRDMKYLVVSRRWSVDYRLSGQPIIGRSHYEVFPEIPQRWIEVYHRCMRGAVENCDEDPFPRADGTTGWLRWEVWPWYRADGSIGGIVIFSEDITDRKHAEAAQRESEERLRLLGDNLPDSYVFQYTRDADGMPQFLYLSAGVERLHGVKVSDVFRDASLLLGQIAPDQIGTFDAAEATSLQRMADFEMELRAIPANGDMRWLHILSRPRRNPDGQVIWDGVATDITERKRVEEELLFRNLLLSTQQEVSIDGILVVDENPHILSYNRRFLEMWGVPAELAEDEMDEPLLRFVADQVADAPAFLQRVHYLYSHRKETSRDEITLKDGRAFDRYSAPMFGPDGRYYGRVWFFRDITDLKIALDEVNRIARFPSENPNPILRVNEVGIIEYTNPACETQLPSWQCYPGNRLPAVIAPTAQAALRRNRLDSVEVECDGRTFLFAIAPIAAERCVNLYGFEISAQREAKKALEYSERQLGRAMELAQAAEWEFDVATATFTFNDRFYALYGTSAEREGGYAMLADEYANRFLFVEDVHIVEDEIARALADPDPKSNLQIEHRILRRDGVTRFITVRVMPVKNEGGQVVKTRGVNQDITERKLAEDERARLAMALEQAAEAFVITDAKGRIRYVNPAFERITGYLRKEAIGQNPRILKSGAQDDAVYSDLWGTIGRGEVWSGRVKNKKKDGTFYEAEMTISPVVDGVGETVSYVAIQRDISEQLELERRLRQSQKMQAMGTLAGGIAHDFNNILGAIMGYGQLVADELPAGSQSKADIDEMMAAAQRATNLVHQILTFSRQIEEERQTVDVGVIVKEALKLLRPSLPATIEIRTDVSEEHCSVIADPTQVHQVIMNLCTNAYHAMANISGTLTVTVQPHTIDAMTAESHPGLKRGEYVRLTVSDTGHGIEEENIERVFEPFFTTKPVGQGTGLGLSTVHGIVTSHGGTVSVYSDVGRGTTFHVYLPCAEVAGATREEREEAVLGGRERILVVDDEVALARLLTRILERLGYEVTVKTNPQEALETFRADPERFDLVITDHTMPKITGAEVVVEIKRLRPNLPIIVNTGHAGEPLKEQLAQAGVFAVISKPFLQSDIARTVRAALDA
jgi:PAS domain S-box-containing protein